MAVFKKKNSKNKLKASITNKGKILASLKKGLIPILLILVIFLLYLGVKTIFIDSPYLQIKSIKVIGKVDYAKLEDLNIFQSVKGKNIFTVNVRDIASVIHENYPEFKKVTVRRVMPDMLEIVIISRVPIALVKIFKHFYIDEEGVVLSDDIKVKKDLPVISGISIWSRPKRGEAIRSNRINSALAILKLVKQTGMAANYDIKRIDVSDIKNVIFYLDDNLEIKMGHGNLLEKLNKLSTMLSDPKIDINNLSYIDLRFKDIVMGPK